MVLNYILVGCPCFSSGQISHYCTEEIKPILTTKVLLVHFLKICTPTFELPLGMNEIRGGRGGTRSRVNLPTFWGNFSLLP